MSSPGYFTRKYGMTITLDSETTQALSVYAEKVHKTPSEIIGELVRKEIVLVPA
jgi:predicted transcriptional regulator